MKENTPSKISNPQSLRVLIVEDSEDDVLLIIRDLKKGGYNPVYERVETATAMKKSLQEKQWDIILCDYKMPKFNAPSAIAVLKEASIDIPLIIVSGTVGEDVAVECMRIGAQDYIMKGNFSRLCPAIARELREVKIKNRQKQSESQREAALKSLRESDERYKALFNGSLDLIYITDFEGNFIDANDNALNRLGYTRADVRSSSITSLLSDDQLPLAIKTLQDIRAGIQINPIEFKLRHKNGSDVYVETQGSIVMSNGIPVAIQAVARDITERKKIEESLRQSEEKYRTILENIEDGYYEVDLAGNFTFFNNSLCRIMGYSQEELMGMNNRQYLDKENAKILFQAFNKVYNTEEPSKGFDWQIIRREGDKRYVESSISLQKDSSGKPIGFRGVVRDVTERKQMEELLKQRESQYRLLADHIQDQVWIMDLNLKMIYISPSVEKLLGYNLEELTQLPLDKLLTELSFQTAMNFFSIELSKALSDPISHLTRLLNIECRRKDGSILWMEAAFSLIRDENGNPLSILGEGRDITERKRTEEELLLTLESLRKSFGTTIQIMVSAVEARDPYTAGHQIRVADLARAIATEMGLPQDQVDGIRLAGSIHDIGKLSIPAEILSKPTKLTAIEFSLIKEHSLVGYEMLKDMESPWPLAEIVYQHHERMNGSGYPRNLKGDEIIMEARIMAVADVVEAMASHRPYRPGLGIDAALEEIEKNKGILYDAAVAGACLRLFREKGYSLIIKKSE